MAYTLSEAAAATGHNRSAIFKSIRRGALSARRDEATGHWLVEPAELHRLYPVVMPSVSKGAVGNGRELADNGELRARLDAAEAAIRFRDETLADLRRRLDRADERLLMLLTDQRAAPTPIRRWWRFGR